MSLQDCGCSRDGLAVYSISLHKGMPMKRLSACLGWLAIVLFANIASRAQAAPTFVGIPTFMGVPYVPNIENIHADFAVLGVPFDEGTWGWAGERYGPRA